MSYDIESLPDGPRSSTRTAPTADGRDLDVIVTLLSIAALELTPVVGAMFTREQLLKVTREIAGDELELHDIDLNLVLKRTGFMREIRSGTFRMK